MRLSQNKIAVAVGAGLLVAATAAGIDLLAVPLEQPLLVNQLVGDLLAGLMTVIVSLAIQLRHEELHYRAAIDRAAIVAELNHHVRNAVFPLCVIIQKIGDAESIRLANDAVERINIALKDATADALSRRMNYSEPSVVSLASGRRPGENHAA